MVPRTQRAVVAAVAAAVVVAGVPGASARPSATRRARLGVRYVVSAQGAEGAIRGGFSKLGSTADAVVAFVAARRAPVALRGALRYLRERYARIDTTGLRAKLVLALVAAGRDPTSFAGRDWVAAIEGSELPSGRFGTDAPVFEHALALLALAAAGATPSANAVSWLVDAQCPDGGWQYDRPHASGEDDHCQGNVDTDFYRSEADATSLAVQALEALASPPVPAADPFDFFPLVRDPVKRGWGYTQTFPLTNANSTALVLQAYAAAGVAPPRRGVRALERLQHRLCGPDGGAFAYSWESVDGRYRRTAPDVGATIGAIPALLGKPLPLAPADVSKRAPTAPACA
ncbi:MAG TPA: hypothetical protein VHK89_00935 [Actinomycetota bacterium]|nr:hypothetical protein [Actinomycetota bacterium]